MMNFAGLRVALCGIGLEAYWDQFPTLKPQLQGYLAKVAGRLSRPGVELIKLGLVDSYRRAREAGIQCRQANSDILFLYVTTYALSNTVLPLVLRAGVPVIVLNLHRMQRSTTLRSTASRSHFDDRTLAGLLRGLPCAGDCEHP